jgi:hypothetical protein
MARRKIGLEQEKEVVAMYEAGSSAMEIALHFGVVGPTIRMALARHGVKMRRGRARFTTSGEDLQKMVDMYRAGKSQKEIGDVFGRSQIMISRFLELAGVEMRRGASGSKHPNWKGGRLEKDGYVFIRLYSDSPFYCMTSNGYVAEHRLKMAKKLGRSLREDETVHHKDLDHSNNRLSNLQLRQGQHGKGGVFQCADCGSHNIKAVSLAEGRS